MVGSGVHPYVMIIDIARPSNMYCTYELTGSNMGPNMEPYYIAWMDPDTLVILQLAVYFQDRA